MEKGRNEKYPRVSIFARYFKNLLNTVINNINRSTKNAAEDAGDFPTSTTAASAGSIPMFATSLILVFPMSSL